MLCFCIFMPQIEPIMHMKNIFFILLISTLVISCFNPETASSVKLFKQIRSEQSSINFSNNLIENDSLNYMAYAYIYMGGGVSAGDINNDGLIDLYFTGNMVENKLYLNKGNLQFEDISVAAGVVFGTCATLLVIPCLLAILNDLRRGWYVMRRLQMPTREYVELLEVERAQEGMKDESGPDSADETS